MTDPMIGKISQGVVNHYSLLLSSSSRCSDNVNDLHILGKGTCNAVDGAEFANSHRCQNYPSHYQLTKFSPIRGVTHWRRETLWFLNIHQQHKPHWVRLSSQLQNLLSNLTPHSRGGLQSHPKACLCSQYNAIIPDLYLLAGPSQSQLLVVVFFH